jgi:hypothetical protein
VARRHFTFRDVIESGHILAIQFGPGPDGAGVVSWDRSSNFTVWLTFDGCTWERAGVFSYDVEGSWTEAQNWAAHRLAQLLAEYRA